MVFAQVKTDGKGQELEAIEQLLGMLDLNGAVVSIDALGCNKNIAGKILESRRAVCAAGQGQPADAARQTPGRFQGRDAR